MVWNFKPQLRPFRFTGHKGAVHDVCVNPAGSLIVTSGSDNTIRIWKNHVDAQHTTIKSHSAPVRSISLSADGTYLLSGSDDRTIKVWTLASRKF